ncbi:MAG: transposase family protein [Treponema sp.]|nr:transposase family protein [Treponema sp.]
MKYTYVYPQETEGECPECKKACALYDQPEDRTWRYLDSCAYKTYIHCRMPRSNCPEHGIRTMEVPWAESLSRFTRLSERHTICLQKTTQNKAAEYLSISWDGTGGSAGTVPAERGADKISGSGRKEFSRGAKLCSGIDGYRREARGRGKPGRKGGK